MDDQLRLLKRAVQAHPDDVETLHRYIGALERAFGGVSTELPQRALHNLRPGRSGWRCLNSPDGVCAYSSEEGTGIYEGRRVVFLQYEGDSFIHQLPSTYDASNESDDWCIFCGDPEERK